MTKHEHTEAKADPPDATAPAARLPHHAREVIGSRLRRLYGSLVAEPLPDRFEALLARLAATEANLVRNGEPGSSAADLSAFGTDPDR